MVARFYEMTCTRSNITATNMRKISGLSQRSWSHTHHTYTIRYCLCGKLKSVRIASHSLNFVYFCHSFSLCPKHTYTHTHTHTHILFIRPHTSYSQSYPYSNISDRLMSLDCSVKPEKTHQKACSTHEDPQAHPLLSCLQTSNFKITERFFKSAI